MLDRVDLGFVVDAQVLALCGPAVCYAMGEAHTAQVKHKSSTSQAQVKPNVLDLCLTCA